MTSVHKILPHYTYDDYVHWEGKWELMDGHPIAMSPLPTPKHQRVCGALYVELEMAIRAQKCKHCKVYLPLDYKIKDDTILQPDILISCKTLEKKYLDTAPILAVEVFSPSTVLRDRNSKFGIYQEQGINYYLMIDPDKELFELYRLIGGKYEQCLHDFSQPFSFNLDDECTINVVLNEIWENV